jgi:hypothetical protein
LISTSCAARRIDALRGVPLLAGTVNATDRVSVPEVADSAIHSASLDALQAQPVGVVTVTVAVPPA